MSWSRWLTILILVCVASLATGPAHAQEPFPQIKATADFRVSGDVEVTITVDADKRLATLRDIEVFGGTEQPSPNYFNPPTPEVAGYEGFKLIDLQGFESQGENEPLVGTEVHKARSQGNTLGARIYWLYAILSLGTDEVTTEKYHLIAEFRNRSSASKMMTPSTPESEPVVDATASFMPDGSVSVNIAAQRMPYHELVKMVLYGGQEDPAPTPLTPPQTDDDEYDGEKLADRTNLYPGQTLWKEPDPSGGTPIEGTYDPLGKAYWLYLELTVRMTSSSQPQVHHMHGEFTEFTGEQEITLSSFVAGQEPIQTTFSQRSAGAGGGAGQFAFTLELSEMRYGGYRVSEIDVWGFDSSILGGWPRGNNHFEMDLNSAMNRIDVDLAQKPKVIFVQLKLKNAGANRYLLFRGTVENLLKQDGTSLQDMTRGRLFTHGSRIVRKVKKALQLNPLSTRRL